MIGWKTTIDINGFTMVLVSKTLVAMGFQWFPMVANNWSDDGMVTIHRSGLLWIMAIIKSSTTETALGHQSRSTGLTITCLDR